MKIFLAILLSIVINGGLPWLAGHIETWVKRECIKRIKYYNNLLVWDDDCWIDHEIFIGEEMTLN